MSARVLMLGTGAEQAVVAVKDGNGSGAKGLPRCADGTAATTGDNADGRTAVKSAKPFPVSKQQVWEAYKRVRAIFDYIEVFYHRARRHSHLDSVSPEAFE